MIFDGKGIYQISDQEITDLVENHVSERQHIEYKLTVNYRDAQERLEVLKDIASFANSEGGYILIGIRDDGHGKAHKFDDKAMQDVDAITKSIQSLAFQYISERIFGLEVGFREILGNKIIIIRIPLSNRKPHMVTFQENTIFISRYHDGKRIMSIGDIRDSFNNDYFGRRLSTIESSLKKLHPGSLLVQSSSSLDEPDVYLNLSDSGSLKTIAYEKFKKTIGSKPYLRICAIPGETKAGLIDIKNSTVLEFFDKPPDCRENGWNIRMSYYPVTRKPYSIYKGKLEEEYLELYDNGFAEFYTQIDDKFCWEQSEEDYKSNPKMYYYAITEYPYTFLKFYTSLERLCRILFPVHLHIQYFNIKGFKISKTSRQEFSTSDEIRQKPFEGNDYFLPPIEIYHTSDVATITLHYLENLYSVFGLNTDGIRLYDYANNKFNFD